MHIWEISVSSSHSCFKPKATLKTKILKNKSQWGSFVGWKLKGHCPGVNSSLLIIPTEICFSFVLPPKG